MTIFEQATDDADALVAHMHERGFDARRALAAVSLATALLAVTTATGAPISREDLCAMVGTCYDECLRGLRGADGEPS